MRRLVLVVLAFFLTGMLPGEDGNGAWLSKVPANDRARTNPFANNPDARAAGANIFAEHCAPCHGEEAQGRQDGKHVRPNLQSDRIKQAKPGELFWLLTNGSQKNGMPAWSRLPEAQRWQLITFLKSLP